MRFFGLFSLLFFYGCSNTTIVEIKDENGNVLERYEQNKEDKRKNGTFSRFTATGELIEMANYQNDTLNSFRILYYESGDTQIVENYYNGIFEGSYKAYYDNGQIELKGNYVKGIMIGQWTRFYKSGELMEIVTFEDNEENGPFIEYYQNGELKAKGNYLNGDNEHGLLELYDERGTLIKKMNCEHGICRTAWTLEGGTVVTGGKSI